MHHQLATSYSIMKPQDIPVLILVGGKGTRVAHLLNDLPKSMYPVLDKPFLDYQLGYLKKFGFQKFILSIGYNSGAIEQHYKNNPDVSFVKEQEALGTGGAIINSLPSINEDHFVALNGDTLFLMDYSNMISFAKKHPEHSVIALKKISDTNRYGNVNINAENKIEGFYEKSTENSTGLINAGIYLFSKKQLQKLQLPKVNSIETDGFPLLVKEGLYGYTKDSDVDFIDIGTPETLDQVESFVKKHNLQPI